MKAYLITEENVMKKWLAMILVLCLAIGLCAGCGDKDDDDKKKKDDVKIEKGDMFEMLEKMGDVKSGDATIDFNFDAGAPVNGSLKMSYNEADKSCKLGLTFKSGIEGKQIDLSIDELFAVADGYLYLNLGDVAKVLASYEKSIGDMIDTSKLGWFKFPLPDDLPSVDTKVQKKYVTTFVTLLENMIKGTDPQGDEGDQTVKLTTKAQYVQALTAMKEFVQNDLKGLLSDSMDSVKDVNIDLNKYVQKIVEEYKSEVVEIGKDYGLDEQQIDAYIKQITSQDLNALVAQYKTQGEQVAAQTISDEDIKKVVEGIDQAIKSLENADDSKEMPECTVRVQATDSAYKANLSLSKSDEGKFEINISLKPGSDKVAAPTKDTMKIKEIVDLVVPYFTMGGGGIKVPTPTPTEEPDPTPTPTEAPELPTPTPTEEPAEPTPTPEFGGSGEEISFVNGKAVLPLSSGSVLKFDLNGNYRLTGSGNDKMSFKTTVDGEDCEVTIGCLDASDFTQEDWDEFEAFKEDSFEGWGIYSIYGKTAAMQLVNNGLVTIVADDEIIEDVIVAVDNVTVTR